MYSGETPMRLRHLVEDDICQKPFRKNCERTVITLFKNITKVITKKPVKLIYILIKTPACRDVFLELSILPLGRHLKEAV